MRLIKALKLSTKEWWNDGMTLNAPVTWCNDSCLAMGEETTENIWELQAGIKLATFVIPVRCSNNRATRTPGHLIIPSYSTNIQWITLNENHIMEVPVQAGHLMKKDLLKQPGSPGVLLTQWLKHLICVTGVEGLNPTWTSETLSVVVPSQ